MSTAPISYPFAITFCANQFNCKFVYLNKTTKPICFTYPQKLYDEDKLELAIEKVVIVFKNTFSKKATPLDLEAALTEFGKDYRQMLIEGIFSF